jgi:hypothetical protein
VIFAGSLLLFLVLLLRDFREGEPIWYLCASDNVIQSSRYYHPLIQAGAPVALTPGRQTVVVAELHYIHTYLTSLAREIDAAAPLTDKRGVTYEVANRAAEQVAHLLHLLAETQEKQRIGEEIRRRL